MSARYGLCRIVEYPEREVRYEVVIVEPLSEAQHSDIRGRFLRLRNSNHPPMPELLEDILEELRTRMRQASDSIPAGSLSPELAHSTQKQGRIGAFAFVNALYSFQEHEQVVARKVGGPALGKSVHSAFSAIYDKRWRYLLAYKLRRILTHVSLDGLYLFARETVDDGSDQPVTIREMRLDRNSVFDEVNTRLRHELQALPGDPPLLTIFEDALAGVWEVHEQTGPMVYPERDDDLAALDRWRQHLLAENPVTLMRIPTTTQTLGSGLEMVFMDPSELLKAGMSPLSA